MEEKEYIIKIGFERSFKIKTTKKKINKIMQFLKKEIPEANILQSFEIEYMENG